MFPVLYKQVLLCISVYNALAFYLIKNIYSRVSNLILKHSRLVLWKLTINTDFCVLSSYTKESTLYMKNTCTLVETHLLHLVLGTFFTNVFLN